MSRALRRSTRTSAQTTCSPSAGKKRKLSVATAASTSKTLAPERSISPQQSASIAAVSKSVSKKVKRTKSFVEPDVSDYPRAINKWKFGAHVSAAGGVENAILNAAEIGANSFALFLKSQRKWVSPSLTEESVALFKSRMKTLAYDPYHVLPHGSYLINLGNPDAEKRQKSYDCFIDDLWRCELLGLPLYNFHPGSTVGEATKEESISHIAQCLNKAHKATNNVITVIENMAGAGNVIGSRFNEIASIIEQVEDKSRVGVCLDTCHLFAAGYDIRTREGYESTLADFDDQIGLRFLRAMHLNDSKMSLGLNKDRHENLGLGHLSLAPFAFIACDKRLQNVPLVLETPISSNSSKRKEESPQIWRIEISVLNRMSKLCSLQHYELYAEPHVEIDEMEAWEGMLKDIENIVGRNRLPGSSERKQLDVEDRCATGGGRDIEE